MKTLRKRLMDTGARGAGVVSGGRGTYLRNRENNKIGGYYRMTTATRKQQSKNRREKLRQMTKQIASMSEGVDYQKLKDKHRAEMEAFEGIFFAFNQKQLQDGMAKVNATAAELFKLPGGGFIRKDRSKTFREMLERFEEERRAVLANRKKLEEALVYELANHEYCITYCVDDALDALGLEKADVPAEILKRAKKAALERDGNETV